ncbi:MAG TPA: hypothetical protein VI959_00755 [Alphaproteobacteria bacterium]|nr:hypothetical protein [Alphaproteobacteria bacterium]
MNLHIYLEQSVFNEIEFLCKQTRKKRNTIIREAISYYLLHQKKGSWSKRVLEFKGIENFEAFEENRANLKSTNTQTFLD